ncbi:hypothetical protein PR202_ga19144 [Eleusine coracana subsp. coracana]|uniref:Protein kinase domain-containing protein n=1 Tax=Eleusine coracana subsp. coracana TaxID=191504 RepID=A0AAV5CTG2_ELECO|nr:hypothetical protein PR202_ga19144 [Eleusine coracana subsp. coracana]
MEKSSSRQEDAAPPWAPSKASAFRRYVVAVASERPQEASPSAAGNGAAARVSSLHGVRRKPFVVRSTADIIQTFERCNPEFKYSEALNPKRFLTNPSTPAHNNGLDNANWDLILYVNLELVNETSNRRFIVKEMLGQGTFGQVVKCLDTESNGYVAVKLNQNFDPDDQHNIVRMLDFLSFQNHLCIAFEMLGQNLYELLKRNHLRGLKMKYVRAFSKQILDAMVVMRDAGIIHCDLKPENILLAPNATTAAAVKVIDFGSACKEGKTVYSYIQSRYYRSPEVLLGSPYPCVAIYNIAIDMWSLGCIVAELFIGLPLFPGASEYDVLQRMMTILGQVLHFDSEIEKTDRLALVDFLKGLLEFDPNKRWSPLQALSHPFITGEPFISPYEPVPETARIPVARAAAINHNPGGGHWLHAGLSPQVGSVNRSLPLNNAYPPNIPLSYESSYGSFGSHGSYTAPSALDPANWDPDYSDESLLQEDSSLSGDLSNSLNLGEATGQASRSTRSSTIQGHLFPASNPVPANQRYCCDVNFPHINP